ncbi:hypothetical protein [Sphingosinicella sp. CPCC 101087]|uniref:hypothetical protein n=1 Tax=Sphingosinicella sp. CPCC 101087 TaxID=2497754 RepID=UPI00197DB1AB|nr:hypothetical protein [Sphingosinicella sp. CPCC 101087]
MALADLARRVASSDYAAWAAESALAYPVANTLHLLGLVLLVGGIGLVDLRLLGLFPRLPLAPLAGALTPLAIGGLIILVASGTVLFAADALSLATSWTFRLKLVLIALALANALVFRWLFGRASPEPPSGAARLMALASLAFWLSVATAGRMIAYS